uniref:Uncharacterized protein n=1 Tax=Glossina pallidipes TaxID=7398 RepID=A0A1A9ZZP0_GLOPL
MYILGTVKDEGKYGIRDAFLWQPIQGTTGDYCVHAEAKNYYDCIIKGVSIHVCDVREKKIDLKCFSCCTHRSVTDSYARPVRYNKHNLSQAANNTVGNVFINITADIIGYRGGREGTETQRRDESAIDILRDDDDDYGGSDGQFVETKTAASSPLPLKNFAKS